MNKFLFVMLTVMLATPAFAITGLWYDHKNRGAVEIYRCGGSYCARIAVVNNKTLEKKYCRRRIFWNLKRVAGGYDHGKITDPSDGSVYDLAAKQNGGSLVITGYMGSKLLSRSYTWRRAPSKLARCYDKPKTEAKTKEVKERVKTLEKHVPNITKDIMEKNQRGISKNESVDEVTPTFRGLY